MNIGVIGSGFIVNVFVQGMAKYKNIHLKAIWGRHLEKIQSFSCFEKYYTDLNDFLNDDSFDVVYLALPNSLHYEYGVKVLKAKKHLMMEKPFTTSVKDSKHLINLAKKNKLLLFETIMTKYEPLFKKNKELLNKIGDIKYVEVNFTQYSRTYEKFKNGLVLPKFDYKLAGGVLMDLGVYSIHYVYGMFGMPKKINYFPNIIKNIDTSGVLILDYGKFKAVLSASKDSYGNSRATIQGEEGFIQLNGTPSRCSDFDLIVNGKKKNYTQADQSEFCGWKYMYEYFFKLYKEKNYEACYRELEDTLNVQKILDVARASANMKF